MMRKLTTPFPRKHPSLRRSLPRDAGVVTIWDFVLILAITGVILPMLIAEEAQSNGTIKAQAAAQQLLTVDQAAAAYIENNLNTILGEAASKPVVITVDDLKQAGYLANGFNNVDSYDQWSVVLARKTSAGGLESLVLTEAGDTLDPVTVRRVAALAGDGAVYIGAGNPTVAQGAYGARTVPLGPYESTRLVPPPGHFGYLTDYTNAALLSPYLDRFEVAGDPEANRMHTAIDMNNNAVNNASDVCITPEGGVCQSQAIYGATVAANGQNIAKPACPAGEYPHIFVAPEVFSENSEAYPLAAVQAYAVPHSTYWTIVIAVLTQDGWSNPDPQHGLAVVLTKCT